MQNILQMLNFNNFYSILETPATTSAPKVGPSFTNIDIDLSGLLSGPGLFLLIIVFLVLAFVMSYLGKQNKQMLVKKGFTFTPATDEEISKVLNGVTRKELVDIAFDVYSKVEDCYNNQNDKELMNYTTNSMYNMYKMQLEELNVKHQRNIIEQLQFVSGDVLSIIKENGFIDMKVILSVKAKDYIINTTTNEILGANKNKLLEYTYEITLLKEVNAKCPKCDTMLEENSDVCPNCHVTVIKNDKWLMGQKVLKEQKDPDNQEIV